MFLCLLMLLIPLTGCNKNVTGKGGFGEVKQIGDASSGTEDSNVTIEQIENSTYDGPPGTWAIYWYLCGTDLESRGGWATTDLRELIEVTLPENVTVIIQTGGTETWQNEVIRSDVIERYAYTGDNLSLVDTQPLTSMGDPQTLADFLDFCNKNYPAEKQGLLLWDHGGGSLFGMESDEKFGRDKLTLTEFKMAIEAVPAVSGKYEFVGVDACLMATIDMVAILEGNARYMIASEEIEPGIGWDYTGMMSALARDTTMSGAQLGKAICDSYYAACAKYKLEEEVTLSVIDISKAGALLAAYEAVGYEALTTAAKEKESYLSAFGRAAYDSEFYGGSSERYEMVDLGDLVRNARSLLPKSGQTLLDALDACVVYQVKGVYRAKASGLSCFYIFSGDEDSCNTFKKLDTSTSFAYFYEYAISGVLSSAAQTHINEYTTQAGQPPVQQGQVVLPPTENMGLAGHPVYVAADGKWHLDLGPELASNLAAVLVNLLWVEPVSGLQVMWGTSQELKADWVNGVFIEDFQDNWGCIDYAQVYMQPVAYERDRILYAVPIQLNGELYSLSVGQYNGEYEILSAVKQSETQLASKTQRRLEPGDVVEPIHYLVPVHDDGSRTIEDMPMGMITVDENTTFYTRPLGDGYFKLTFEMIDYAGQKYYSKECSFRVRNRVLERLPGGVVSNAVRPDNSYEVNYIRTETWLHEAWNQEIEYFAASVSFETYRALSSMTGTNPDYDGMTGTYTIQLVSDTIDLSDYEGVQVAYVTGTVYPADSAFHQRDIIFNVTSVTEVW